jgi:hypothetical protein
MNSGSCSARSLSTTTNCSTAEDCLRTVTPERCTSDGRRARADCTRLLTFTVAMSGLVPSAKETDSA